MKLWFYDKKSLIGKFHHEANPIRRTRSSENQNVNEDETNENISCQFPDDEDDTLAQAFWKNFLGHASPWYKKFIICAIVINTILRWTAGKKVTAWAVLLEFMFTLAMSMQSYPLQSGGIIVVHGLLLGLSDPDVVLHEIEANLNVLLLLIFMVACIHFLKNLLLWIFTNILLGIKNKKVLSLVFVSTSAILSAFHSSAFTASVPA